MRQWISGRCRFGQGFRTCGGVLYASCEFAASLTYYLSLLLCVRVCVCVFVLWGFGLVSFVCVWFSDNVYQGVVQMHMLHPVPYPHGVRVAATCRRQGRDVWLVTCPQLSFA